MVALPIRCGIALYLRVTEQRLAYDGTQNDARSFEQTTLQQLDCDATANNVAKMMQSLLLSKTHHPHMQRHSVLITTETASSLQNYLL